MFYYSYISTFSNLFKFNITRNIRNDDVVANHFITYNLIYVISNTSYQLELMISFFFFLHRRRPCQLIQLDHRNFHGRRTREKLLAFRSLSSSRFKRDLLSLKKKEK